MVNAGKRASISLKSIAETLGVSRTTVSWVLSGQGDEKSISPAMQQKIKSFAAEHNYQPNFLARSLNLHRTNTIGLIVSSLADPFYSSIAKSVVTRAEENGYSVMMTTSESSSEREVKLIEMLRHRQVDGIILTPSQQPKEYLRQVVNEGYNLVMLDRNIPELETTYVVADNKESSYELVSSLVRNGSRKVAIFTTAHDLGNMQFRYDGYREALENAGLEASPELFCDVSESIDKENVVKRVDRLLNEVPDVDGFFFTTHVLVLPVYIALKEKDYPTNGGAGWACIHSQPEFSLLLPNMSVAQLPTEELGARSVDVLLKSLNHEEFDSRNVLGCDLRLH